MGAGCTALLGVVADADGLTTALVACAGLVALSLALALAARPAHVARREPEPHPPRPDGSWDSRGSVRPRLHHGKVLADDARTFAPLAVEPRTRAVLTPAPRRRLLREGLTSRRGVPWWGVTLRVLDGPACGAYAALRLWPASANRACSARRVSELTGLDLEVAETLDPHAARVVIQSALGTSSYRATVETGSGGELEVAFIDARLQRVEPHPTLPVAPRPHPVAPPLPPVAPLLDPESVR